MTAIIMRGIAYTGIVLTIILAGLIVSFEVCAELGILHPLGGGLIPTVLFLVSPLILVFQILATLMTSRSNFTGGRKFAAYLINILGAAIGLWMVMMLFSLWKTGPINSG